MRTVDYRFTSVFALACVALLCSCQSLLNAAPKPSARVTAASLNGLSLDKVELLFDVEVSNPYTVSLPLLDLGYTVSSGGLHIVEGSATPAGAIPARGSKVVQVPASIEFASLLGVLKGVQPGAVVPYTVEFNLGVEAPVIGRMNVPLSRSGEIPVPTLPEISIISLEIGALSLDRVDATVRLHVKNTNQFDVDLSKLGLDLALGGKRVAQTQVVGAANLAPGQSAGVDVPISFSPRAFGIGLFKVLRGSQATYNVSGELVAGTRFGPITLPFVESGKTPISR